MDEIRIFWTNIAVKQRDLVFEYWNNRNKSNTYSKKLKLAIKEKTNIIKEQPNIGKSIKNSNSRILFFSNYSLIYKQETHSIYITGFWDNRQNPQKLYDLLGL